MSRPGSCCDEETQLPRARTKGELPTKTCPVCGRPFTWRKKWARAWEQVVYCSERCRRKGRPAAADPTLRR